MEADIQWEMGEALNVLDLFSGIGGFSLGLERAGMRTVAFAEIDPYCSDVLKKHWPAVPNYGDVRNLSAQHLTADGIEVDVICGGFPCQDISVAGNGAGITGERSGLWSEFARLIGEVRPRYAIVENVAALLGRGIDRVLGDLAALGYDAEWHCIPASAVGAPHRRDRIWIVAYAKGERERSGTCCRCNDGRGEQLESTGARRNADDGSEAMADSHRHGLQGSPGSDFNRKRWSSGVLTSLYQTIGGQWEREPDVGRVANGIPARVDRLRALGNALIPQIPEIIGRAIMSQQ